MRLVRPRMPTWFIPVLREQAHAGVISVGTGVRGIQRCVQQIGEAGHERFVIDIDRYLERLQKKFGA